MSLSSILKPNSLHLYGDELTSSTGSSVNPSISFVGFETSGFSYDSGNTSLAFSVQGVEVMDIKQTGLRLFNNDVGYVPSVLNAYMEISPTTVAYSFNGGSGDMTYEAVRVGKQCTLNVTGFNGVVGGGGGNITTVALPAIIRPSLTVNQQIYNAADGVAINVQIATTGVITFSGLTAILPAGATNIPNFVFTFKTA